MTTQRRSDLVRRSRRRRCSVYAGMALLGGAALATVAPSAALASEVDPFYASRFHEGRAAYDRRDFQEAAFSLRLACFGMLEAPAELAECLVWLAMAQAGADDREGFAATYRRLAEAEELVGLYSDSELPSELRASFESRLIDWIPPSTLAATPAFAELASRREERRLEMLSQRARRTQLQRLMEEHPKEARWPYLLSVLELEEGRSRPALEASEQALQLGSSDGGAACVRGWALAGLGRCDEAFEALELCIDRGLAFATALLECQVAAEDWAAARGLLAQMEPSWLQASRISRLAAQVDRHQASPSPQLAPEEPLSRPAAEPTSALGTNGLPLAAPAAEQLDQAREAAVSARSAGELEQAYRQVRAIVAAYPGSQAAHFLAGEIAYRASRWQEAVGHFRDGGGPDESEPHMVFYYAVALYESGDREAAAEILRCCSDLLRSTPFVDEYVRRILGGS